MEALLVIQRYQLIIRPKDRSATEITVYRKPPPALKETFVPPYTSAFVHPVRLVCYKMHHFGLEARCFGKAIKGTLEILTVPSLAPLINNPAANN